MSLKTCQPLFETRSRSLTCCIPQKCISIPSAFVLVIGDFHIQADGHQPFGNIGHGIDLGFRAVTKRQSAVPHQWSANALVLGHGLGHLALLWSLVFPRRRLFNRPHDRHAFHQRRTFPPEIHLPPRRPDTLFQPFPRHLCHSRTVRLERTRVFNVLVEPCAVLM